MRLATLALFFFTVVSVCVAQDPYYHVGLKTAQWLQTAAIQKEGGMVWPADPRDPATVNVSLYSGTPGPVLFFLELYRSTGDRKYLGPARAGVDALLASMATTKGSGLYDGIAGIGFTSGEAYLITHEKKYRDGALRCVELLGSRAKKAGAGVEWSSTEDIISGSSGTGLFLLWADEHLHAPGARQLAVKAGDRLIELGRQAGTRQLKWMMDPGFPTEMPNFAHGTAGVAYFLASLYRVTHDGRFLEAALAGANYLLSIADKQDDLCLVYHDSGHKDIYYLGWCHGPVGTARLFYRLYQVTNDPAWLAWVEKAARATAAKGAPERVVTPGEWDNISVCCGVAGQAAFFLNMSQVLHEPKYLDLARKASALLVSKAKQDESGARWVQAEHRVRPELLVAQTGYMQGASGAGIWLLHFSNFLNHKGKPVITLPDNPFPY